MKIVVGVTGASGSVYAKLILSKLEKAVTPQDEVYVVWSDNAKTVWQTEMPASDFNAVPFPAKDKNDFFAPFASGSAGFDALIIAPCSMGTLARIAAGTSNDLITRTADVMLKERKKLVCVVRETPYSAIHLKNMLTVTESGGIICPASPSFYSLPKTIDELAGTVADRALQLAGVDVRGYRWGYE